MLTDEEIKAHIKRLDAQIEGLKNGILDRAARPDFNGNDPAVSESHASLEQALAQKELLVNELRTRDGQ